MKSLINFIVTLFLLAIAATAFAFASGMSLPLSLAATLVASMAFSLVPMPSGALRAVVLRQLWEAELLTAFRATRSWMSRIPRKDQFVGNNAINLQEVGADPSVLINNTVYPITTAARVDDTNVLALNRYDTTNTSIQHAELYALPYAKEGSVIMQHRDTLVERTGEHGLWTLCPSGDSANTPLIETTGGDNGAGRKRLRSLDLIRLKERLDNLKVPAAGRTLVLCSAHVADLLIEDQSFQLRYNNTEKGTIMPNFYGFDIFEDVYNPVFTAANAKKAFGAAAAGTDRNASTCFFAPRAFQATGTVEMYYEDKFTNPTMRQTVVGFSLYHMIAPMKNIGFGAIVSDDLL